MEDGGMDDTHNTHIQIQRRKTRKVRQTGREKKKGTRACIGPWPKCTWEMSLRKSEERRRNRKKHHFITVHVGNKKISAHWSLPAEITEMTEMRTFAHHKSEKRASKEQIGFFLVLMLFITTKHAAAYIATHANTKQINKQATQKDVLSFD